MICVCASAAAANCGDAGQRSGQSGRCSERQEPGRASAHPRQERQRHDYRGEPRPKQARAGVARPVQKRLDSARQLRPAHRGSHRRGRSPAAIQFHHAGEARCVASRLTRGRQHEIVAGDLALQVDPPADPPRHGMQRQQRFERPLDEHGAVVVTREMCGLVQPDLLHGALVHLVQQPRRKQDRRPQRADCRRDADLRGGRQAHAAPP